MSAKIQGFDALKRKLLKLEKKAARTALRKATNAGTAVLLDAVKQTVPREHGIVAKMMDKKTSAKRMTAFGVVGANVAKLEAADGAEGDAHRPSNIDHLLEEGHVTPDGTLVPPTGFMRRAADSSKATAERVFLDTLESEITKAASG
jgi:hypothetical protein